MACSGRQRGTAFVAELRAERPAPVDLARSHIVIVVLVLAFVGFASLWALRNRDRATAARSSVCAPRSQRMPAILTRAFYFDAVLDLVRAAVAS